MFLIKICGLCYFLNFRYVICIHVSSYQLVVALTKPCPPLHLAILSNEKKIECVHYSCFEFQQYRNALKTKLFGVTMEVKSHSVRRTL